jgi:hypothetical protein
VAAAPELEPPPLPVPVPALDAASAAPVLALVVAVAVERAEPDSYWSYQHSMADSGLESAVGTAGPLGFGEPGPESSASAEPAAAVAEAAVGHGLLLLLSIIFLVINLRLGNLHLSRRLLSLGRRWCRLGLSCLLWCRLSHIQCWALRTVRHARLSGILE